MPTNKRITDLLDYKAVLPYASEMFGVYQPLIGWKSRRILQRMNEGLILDDGSKYKSVVAAYQGHADVKFNADHNLATASLEIGTQNTFALKPQHESVLLQAIAKLIEQGASIPKGIKWLDIINEKQLRTALNTDVLETYKTFYKSTWKADHFETANERLVRGLQTESAIAGALLGYATNALFDKLETLFFFSKSENQVNNLFSSLKETADDPFISFDPKKDIGQVSLSPVGIVHLYRQYFFELDTFLGTPVSHVWLSPGSTVELIESTLPIRLTQTPTRASVSS